MDNVEVRITAEEKRLGNDKIVERLKAAGMPVENNKYGGIIARQGVLTKRPCTQFPASDIYTWKSVAFILKANK